MAQSLQIQRISKAWHERVVDLEIENPTMSLGEIARECGVTPSHLSVVRNSDAFLEYRALRMREHQDRVSEGIVARTQKVAAIGLEVLHERIVAEREEIGLALLKDVTEMTLKSLGYGPRPGVNVTVDNSRHNHLSITEHERDAFHTAREKLKLVNQHNTEVLEAEAVPETAHPAPDEITGTDANELYSDNTTLEYIPAAGDGALETVNPEDPFAEFFGAGAQHTPAGDSSRGGSE